MEDMKQINLFFDFDKIILKIINLSILINNNKLVSKLYLSKLKI
jgi:hypothetical protein